MKGIAEGPVAFLLLVSWVTLVVCAANSPGDCSPTISVMVNPCSAFDVSEFQVSQAEQMRQKIHAFIRAAKNQQQIPQVSGGALPLALPPTPAPPIVVGNGSEVVIEAPADDFTDRILNLQTQTDYRTTALLNVSILINITSDHFFKPEIEDLTFGGFSEQVIRVLPQKLGRRGEGEPQGFVENLYPHLVKDSLANNTNFTTSQLKDSVLDLINTNLAKRSTGKKNLTTNSFLFDIDPISEVGLIVGAILLDMETRISAELDIRQRHKDESQRKEEEDGEEESSDEEEDEEPLTIDGVLMASVTEPGIEKKVVRRLSDKQLEILLPHVSGFGLLLDEHVNVVVDVDKAIQLSSECLASIVNGDMLPPVNPSDYFTIQASENPFLKDSRTLIEPVAAIALGLALIGSGGGSGTAFGDVQSLAMLGQMQCANADLRFIGMEMKWFVSPFFSFGVEAVVLGNIAIPVAFFLLHALLILCWYVIFPASFLSGAGLRRVCSKVRFPTLPLVIASLCYQGLAFGTAFLGFNLSTEHPLPPTAVMDRPDRFAAAASLNQPYLLDPTSSTLLFGVAPSRGARIVIFVVGVVALLALPYAYAAIYRAFVLPSKRLMYQPYTELFQEWPAFANLFLFPAGYWRPLELVQAFGASFSTCRPTRAYWVIFPFVVSTLISFAAMFRLESNEDTSFYCIVQMTTVSLFHAFAAVLSGAAFPSRLKISNYCSVVGFVLLGGIVACDAVAVQHHVKETSFVKAYLLFAFLSATILRSLVEIIFIFADSFVWRKHMKDRFGLHDADLFVRDVGDEHHNDHEMLLVPQRSKENPLESSPPPLTLAALETLEDQYAVERDAAHLVDILFDTSSSSSATFAPSANSSDDLPAWLQEVQQKAEEEAQEAELKRRQEEERTLKRAMLKKERTMPKKRYTKSLRDVVRDSSRGGRQFHRSSASPNNHSSEDDAGAISTKKNKSKQREKSPSPKHQEDHSDSAMDMSPQDYREEQKVAVQRSRDTPYTGQQFSPQPVVRFRPQLAPVITLSRPLLPALDHQAPPHTTPMRRRDDQAFPSSMGNGVENQDDEETAMFDVL